MTCFSAKVRFASPPISKDYQIHVHTLLTPFPYPTMVVLHHKVSEGFCTLKGGPGERSKELLREFLEFLIDVLETILDKVVASTYAVMSFFGLTNRNASRRNKLRAEAAREYERASELRTFESRTSNADW